MNNSILQLKIKQRINKLSSLDYDNIECWQVVEAFNKAQVSWCRRQLHGLNVKQTGDEQSKRRIDDLQILLKEEKIALRKHKDYVESVNILPEDYFEYKRLSGMSSDGCCENRKMVIYLAEEANVDELLRDKMKQPSFEWGETFCTLKTNRIRVYTNDTFELKEVTLSYYRQPRLIQILQCVDPYTSTVSLVNVECEFKDDIVELMIDEAVKILAGDIESYNQQQTASGQVEGNN